MTAETITFSNVEIGRDRARINLKKSQLSKQQKNLIAVLFWALGGRSHLMIVQPSLSQMKNTSIVDFSPIILIFTCELK